MTLKPPPPQNKTYKLFQSINLIFSKEFDNRQKKLEEETEEKEEEDIVTATNVWRTSMVRLAYGFRHNKVLQFTSSKGALTDQDSTFGHNVTQDSS